MNALVPDGKTANVPLADNATKSASLRVTGFNLGVPPGARIQGVVVAVLVQQNGTTAIIDEAVTLMLGSRLSDPDDNDEPLPSKLDSVTYGDEEELWGLDAELSPQAVNAPDFGVAYEVKLDGTTGAGVASVDAIAVEVHYCE